MPKITGVKRVIISCLFIYYVFGAFLWSYPSTSPFRNVVLSAYRSFFNFTGAWQSWSMFAPNARSQQIYLTAEITFRDQSVTVWEFPRMEKMGWADKYLKERFRKWAADHVRLDKNSALWQDAARYVARIHFKSEDNPPVSVKLIRHWADLPPISDRIPASPWNRFAFYNVSFNHPGEFR